MFKLKQLLKEKKTINKEEDEFILNFKPFLNEEFNQEDILSEDEVQELTSKLDKLNDELTKLRAVPQEERTEKFWEHRRAVQKELNDVKNKLNIHTKTKKYFETEEGLAEEKDWDELFDILPEEFEFEDLHVEVESEASDEPVGWNYNTDSIIYKEYPAQHGYVENWTYTIYPSKELIARMLNKKIEDITKRDLASFDEDDYYDFILNDEKCIEEVSKYIQDNWEYDDVIWDEPEEPDYDDYYD